MIDTQPNDGDIKIILSIKNNRKVLTWYDRTPTTLCFMQNKERINK